MIGANWPDLDAGCEQQLDVPTEELYRRVRDDQIDDVDGSVDPKLFERSKNDEGKLSVYRGACQSAQGAAADARQRNENVVGVAVLTVGDVIRSEVRSVYDELCPGEPKPLGHSYIDVRGLSGIPDASRVRLALREKLADACEVVLLEQ